MSNRIMKLEDCVSLIIDCRGKTPQKLGSNWVDEGIRVISANNVHDGMLTDENEIRCINDIIYDKWMKESVQRGDCFLVSEGATLGESLYWDSEEKVVLGQRLYAIRTKKHILDSKYFSLYLRTNVCRKSINAISTGSTVFGISQKDLLKLEIIVPDIYIQREIGQLKYELDKKIQNNNRIGDELESMAKTIYDYWFLQFDFPDENGKPYKSSGGEMVWNEELKREIPVGWCVKPLNKYIAKEKGGDWGKEVEEGNYIKKVICLRGADFPALTGNAQLLAPVRYILEKNIYKTLKDGDLIVEISGGSPTQSTGRICYINNGLLERFDTDAVTSNFCNAISLINPNYMYWFYVQWLRIYDNNVLFKYEGKTTGIKNLLFDMFVNDYKIAAPPNKLIMMYNDIVCAMFEEIQKKQKQSQELASLRDFLLPLLMNGQVGFK